MKRIGIAGIVAAGALMVTAMVGAPFASAQEPEPVGEPGTPTCHGERVSTGSSERGLTPKDRAEALEEIIFLETGQVVDISVKEFHQWVRFNCESPGPQLDLISLYFP